MTPSSSRNPRAILVPVVVLVEGMRVASVPGIESSLVERIQPTRPELLDLSARNRLISTPRGPSRGRWTRAFAGEFRATNSTS